MNAKLMSENTIDFNNVVISWGKIMPYFVIFILNNNLLTPQLLLRHRYWLYSICLVVMIVTMFGGIELFDFSYWQTDYKYKASLTDLAWYWNVLIGVLMAGANAMIKLYYRAIETERRMALLEKQNIETQMKYLMYQINPHFLMNTLNNIHAMIDFDSTMAKRSVMELSRMMRHVLYDSSEEHTTLDKEVEFLHNYIELMRIRYDDDVDIKFTAPDITRCRSVKMPPLLLIVLVENAFKHGISYNNKSFITISISVDANELTCVVANSRHDYHTAGHSGIGLNNITKRLDILFGDGYTLSTDHSDKNIYIVELVIPIIKK